MRSLYALVKKDLKGYFDQPTGYVLIVIFAGVLSYLFFFVTPFSTTSEASTRDLFTILPWLLVVFVPAVTMRLVAEEQRDGTLEILLTQPIRGWLVLLGKSLSGLIFVAVAILATIGIPISLQIAAGLDEIAGGLDVGATFAQYLGTLLLATSFVSIGVFTSSLTRNQILAFILGLTLIALLMLVGLQQISTTLPSRVSGPLQTLSPLTHFASMARGVIDLRDGLYFVAVTLTFLSAAYLMIRSKSISHQSPLYRNLRLGVAGLIVFSLLLGWFGNSIGGRLDLTEDKLFTLSPATTKILSRLDDILTVELFESRDPPPELKPVARDVNDFLQDFAAASIGKVKLVHRFPIDDTDDALKARLAGVFPTTSNVMSQGQLQIKAAYLGVVMTYVDGREVFDPIQSFDGFEYRLATLANKLVERDPKTVAFLGGHGELSKDSGLQILNSLLEQQYEVRQVRETEEEPLDLSDVDVLVIPGPLQEIPEIVRQEIDRYLNNGGKAMILIESVRIDQELNAIPNRNSFADFVAQFGVIVDDNLVFDTQSNETIAFSTGIGVTLRPYPYWMRVTTVEDKIARGVGTVLLPWASSVRGAESGAGSVSVIPLLETTPFAAIDLDYGPVGPVSPKLNPEAKHDLAQNRMAVAVTGRSLRSATNGSEQEFFRLVVVGDAEWLTDGMINRNPDNLVMGLNLIDWLAQEDVLASIRDKVVSSRLLLLSSATRKTVQYANIASVPLAFVLLGLFRLFKRHNLSSREYRRER